MNNERDYIKTFNSQIFELFRNALKLSLKEPGQAIFFIKSLLSQKKASKRRLYWENRGIQVPPLMIVSITNKCNLNCAGCYARAHKKSDSSELTVEQFNGLLEEANDLGISLIMLAGGEPFTRPDLIDLTERYKNIIFPVFTNGLLLDKNLLASIKKQKNIIPVLSIEGNKYETDSRRGMGIFDHVLDVADRLKKNKFFWGVSITVTSSNHSVVTDSDFLSRLKNRGCKIFFFVEYVPIQEDTEHLVLTEEQKNQLISTTRMMNDNDGGLFITLPGDESEFGGCLAAGRGFIHVSAEGNIEPCPFAPYSDQNLSKVTLKEALKSDFLKTIRQNHSYLQETAGGCALWSNRDWVKTLLVK